MGREGEWGGGGGEGDRRGWGGKGSVEGRGRGGRYTKCMCPCVCWPAHWTHWTCCCPSGLGMCQRVCVQGECLQGEGECTHLPYCLV